MRFPKTFVSISSYTCSCIMNLYICHVFPLFTYPFSIAIAIPTIRSIRILCISSFISNTVILCLCFLFIRKCLLEKEENVIENIQPSFLRDPVYAMNHSLWMYWKKIVQMIHLFVYTIYVINNDMLSWSVAITCFNYIYILNSQKFIRNFCLSMPFIFQRFAHA